MRGKWSVWRTEWNSTVNAWLTSCVVGYWSLRWCMLMTKGGQQVPQPKFKAKAPARSRESDE